MTHVVLKVILQIFVKNMYDGLAYVAFSNISSRLWLGDNKIWQILSIKEIYQVLIQAYNLLILQRLLKIFSHGQYGLTHNVLSKKIIKLRLNCIALLKTFIQKLYVLNHSPLKYFMQVSTKSSILFSIFIKSCIFFSIYTILNKFESGNTGWSIFFFLKKWLIFVKNMYGSNYVVFSFHFQWFIFLLWNILDKCQSWTIQANPYSPF